jgi:hypothetical protein
LISCSGSGSISSGRFVGRYFTLANQNIDNLVAVVSHYFDHLACVRGIIRLSNRKHAQRILCRRRDIGLDCIRPNGLASNFHLVFGQRHPCPCATYGFVCQTDGKFSVSDGHLLL